MSKGRWIDRDLGMQALVEELRQTGGARVTVGVHGDAEPYVRGQSSPANAAQVASFNEFGTRHIPERPFMRSTFDAKQGEWTKLISRALKQVRTGGLRRILNILGIAVTADVQRSIIDGPWAPNAPSTIARKGSTQPLFNTGHLRQSITFKVRH